MFKQIPFLLAIFSLLFVVACGDDDDVIDVVDPDITLIDTNNVNGSIVSPGDTLRVTIEALAGTNEINSLSIFENGERLPNFEDRLFFNGDPAPSAVVLLDSNSREEFTIDVMILAADMAGTYEVEFEVADDDDNAATVEFSYFVSDITTLEGVLLNSGGPEGTGGLDLDTGEGTGSEDPQAEIRDLGIDLGAPADSVNWIQRIAPVEEQFVEHKIELATLSSEFDFDAVATQVQVAEAFDDANAISESDVVEVGDMFAVRTADDRHYILLVTDVNIDPVANDDYYTFTIKQGQ